MGKNERRKEIWKEKGEGERGGGGGGGEKKMKKRKEERNKST